MRGGGCKHDLSKLCVACWEPYRIVGRRKQPASTPARRSAAYRRDKRVLFLQGRMLVLRAAQPLTAPQRGATTTVKSNND